MFGRVARNCAITTIALIGHGCANTCAKSADGPATTTLAPTPAAWSPVPAASLILTSSGSSFAQSRVGSVTEGAAPDLVVSSSETAQVITGFGGAFNEQGWEALSALGSNEREQVIESLFDPNRGLRLTWGRVPVGASDYALDRYTLDETPGDYALDHFSIERDKQRLIPFILAAKKHLPGLRLWASAWTPPTWMKTNGAFDGGAMKGDPRTYAAYALYLTKFVQSYREQGVDIQMVVPQNEPGQITHYPSCDWKPEQYREFIAQHLAPTLRRHGLSTEIFIGTINQHDWDVLSVLADPATRAQIAGVALQWQGLPHVAKIHAEYPELTIMQSETECGNNHWQPGFNSENAPNDFGYAAYTWRKFRDFIRAGSSSYMLWNLVLNEHGKNIDALKPWPQNSAVVVDRSKKTVTYTPLYWVTKHFSGLVDVGARLARTSGTFDDGIAFINPNGTTVIELLNTQPTPTRVTIRSDQRNYSVELPAQSFASLVIPKG